MWVKWEGHESDCTPLSSTEVKNVCGTIPTFSEMLSWHAQG